MLNTNTQDCDDVSALRYISADGASSAVRMLPTLDEISSDVVDAVTAGRCSAVFVFDASRLAAFERQHGAVAFDALFEKFVQALARVCTQHLGDDVMLCVDAREGDSVLIFPSQSEPVQGAWLDLEDQLYSLQKDLIARIAELQLWYQDALEAIASGSSVILHNSAVNPRRAIYRAIRLARHDAQVAYGEVQRRRHRIVGHVIANQKLRTFYQPLVNLESGETFGFEALSRPWEREARKLGVHLFVAASRAELESELDAICRSLSIERRPKLGPGQCLFVNCLPQTFYDEMTELEGVLALWEASGMKPAQLVFEVTENITKKQFKRILANVRALRARGYRFALDDVGTGTSNLELLIEFEPDVIKMDMSLTIGISKNKRKQELAEYLLELSRRTGAQLLAEGIEDAEDLQAVRDLGVRFGQGYLLGRPCHDCSQLSARVGSD